MKSVLSVLAAVVATATPAFAHYRWTNLVANGSTTADYYYVRQNTNYNSPVTDVTSTDIRCNTGTQASAASTHIGTVSAGTTVGLGLDQATYHPGVATLYMTKVSNANTADGSTQWFKARTLTPYLQDYTHFLFQVAQLGPTFGPGSISWPATGIQQYTFTIPKTLPSGQYLLRAEQIALHVAQSVGGAQFYLSCAQINVVNGGSGTPGPLVSFPGAYKATDPGILININYPIPTNYTFPGPAVWKG